MHRSITTSTYPFKQRFPLPLSLAVLVLLVSACATSTAPQTEQVVVADIDGDDAVVTANVTREELEDQVRRFADRYMTRIAIATREVRDATDLIEVRRFMEDWRNVSDAAIVEVAIGPDAVTNLMDMMVLTMLSRQVVEDYWAPKITDDAVRAVFLDAFKDLEADIWAIADDVLTEAHQDELRDLVSEWHAENPEQVFPWYVRLNNFSGQRAASLNAVKQSGGMLAEVARAREAAEEMQAFGERVLFYMQRAPRLTSGQFEASANDVLSGPEVARLLDDLSRFVSEVGRFITLAEGIPDSRLTAIDQLMDRVAEEREALLADIAGAEPQLQATLQQMLPVLESIERTVAMTSADDPNSEPFDINEYRAFVNEMAVTSAELRLLVQSLAGFMAGTEDLSDVQNLVSVTSSEVLDQFFLRMVGFLIFFFVMLLATRFVWVRMSSK